MNHRGHDPGGHVVEVYDHTQPSHRLRESRAVEALTTRKGIILTIIRPLDGAEDRIDIVEQPVALALREMEMRANVEHDVPAVRIGRCASPTPRSCSRR